MGAKRTYISGLSLIFSVGGKEKQVAGDCCSLLASVVCFSVRVTGVPTHIRQGKSLVPSS